MFGFIKNRLFFLLAKLVALRYRCAGIRLGRDCIITGFPVFRRAKGSQIILHDRVVLHSNPRYNKLIRSRMELATITPTPALNYMHTVV